MKQYDVQASDIYVLIQAAILGFLFGEIWYFSQAVGSIFTSYLNRHDLQFIAAMIWVISAISVSAYIFLRDGIMFFKKLVVSKRVDLLVLFIFGQSISFTVGGLGTSEFNEYLGHINIPLLMLISGIPIIISLMLLIRVLIGKDHKESPTSYFINDKPIDIKNDDSLGICVFHAKWTPIPRQSGQSERSDAGVLV